MALRSINIELRDIMNDELARQELLQGGGKAVVPCLRIKNGDSVDWLYESMDIIRYLDERFSASRA
jgi:glutathione S-transferase